MQRNIYSQHPTMTLSSVKRQIQSSTLESSKMWPRLSQWQLNGVLIKGELVQLNGNLMQIWSHNDSQWIISEDAAAEQKPCNSSRDSLMHSFTPNNFWRQDWIYSHSKYRETAGVIHPLYRQNTNLLYLDNWIYRYTITKIYQQLWSHQKLWLMTETSLALLCY